MLEPQVNQEPDPRSGRNPGFAKLRVAREPPTRVAVQKLVAAARRWRIPNSRTRLATVWAQNSGRCLDSPPRWVATASGTNRMAYPWSAARSAKSVSSE